jgi:hypothetical protein
MAADTRFKEWARTVKLWVPVGFAFFIVTAWNASAQQYRVMDASVGGIQYMGHGADATNTREGDRLAYWVRIMDSNNHFLRMKCFARLRRKTTVIALTQGLRSLISGTVPFPATWQARPAGSVRR